MKIVKRYGLIAPMILLQVTTNVWGMDTNPKDHYDALTRTWQNRKELSDEEVEKNYNQILANQSAFQQKFKGDESPALPRFPLKPNFPDRYYRLVNSTDTIPVEFQKIIVADAQQTIPIFSQKALIRACSFLESKKISDSPIERNFYKTMTITDFFVRLYTKRPLVCYNSDSGYKVILLNKEGIYIPYKKSNDVIQKLKDIGTPQEQFPFALENILSLAEAEIGALCGISSQTFFINDGNRQNQGQIKPTPFEDRGVQIGLVGDNHEISGFFGCKNLIKEKDAQDGDIKITKDNVNKNLHGYGDILGLYYRPSIGKERIKDILCNALYEANTRGKYINKPVFLHVVGIGLGAWQLFKTEKEDIEMVNLLGAVKELLEDSKHKHNFENISNIDFSWINASQETLAKVNLQNGQTIGKIKISFSTRNPAAKLTEDNEGKYIVALYPWDSYAQVGNEYWDGLYSASGDPAAACSSLIPTLQNPEINHFFVENIVTAVKNGLSLLNPELNQQKSIKEEIKAENNAKVQRLETEVTQQKEPAKEKKIGEEKAATEQTLISKLFSHRGIQAIGAISVIGTLCYLFTTSEQKDCIIARFMHYWEKMHTSRQV